MNATFVAELKAEFGTVSGQTETGGTVAVRNKTALKKLEAFCVGRATVARKTSGESFPALVRVEEVVR